MFGVQCLILYLIILTHRDDFNHSYSPFNLGVRWKWSASWHRQRNNLLAPTEQEGLVDPTTGLDVLENTQIFRPRQDSYRSSSIPQSIIVSILTLLSRGLKSVRFAVIPCNLPRPNLRREVHPSISQLH